MTPEQVELTLKTLVDYTCSEAEQALDYRHSCDVGDIVNLYMIELAMHRIYRMAKDVSAALQKEAE